MTADGPTVVVVGAGYEGKRRCYERLAALGARLVIVDEPGHWSESLAEQIAGARWLAVPISGDPDANVAAILAALERSGVRPDGVLTFREDRVCEAARVAAGLGLPGNPPEAVDAARSVSQNWPTAEPSFQETGLHLPPDHNRKAVRELVDLSVRTVQSFGFRRGVLHVEGKCTRNGPRVIEVNARMGGARIHQMVEAVWGVDLIEAQLRSCLDLPQTLKPSRRPRCAVVNAIVYAPATGHLADLPFTQVAPEAGLGVELDILAETGQEVSGPDRTFATALAELTLSGKNLRHARRRAAQVLRDPPRIIIPA